MRFGLGLFRAWRRRDTPELELERTIPRWERVAPQVSAQYFSLYKYLDHRYASVVVLSFEQIDTLLGFALPVLARTEPGWWTAVDDSPKAHCSAWTGAGRTAVPNLLAGNVAFERHP